MEITKKIETAVAAYLTAYVGSDPESPASYWPASLKDAGGNLRIYTGESNQTKDGQALLCIAEDSNEETPQFTGNQMIPVQIWLRTPAKVLTAAETAALQPTAIDNHDAAAALISDALNIDPFELAAAINAIATDLTIMGGVMDLKPQRAEPANFFASGWTFRVYCMGKVAP